MSSANMKFFNSPSMQGINCTSPGRTSRGTRNIISQHLRTIRVLEERLAVKENDVKSKDEALKEATEDLARDERIFAEKVALNHLHCIHCSSRRSRAIARLRF